MIRWRIHEEIQEVSLELNTGAGSEDLEYFLKEFEFINVKSPYCTLEINVLLYTN